MKLQRIGSEFYLVILAVAWLLWVKRGKFDIAHDNSRWTSYAEFESQSDCQVELNEERAAWTKFWKKEGYKVSGDEGFIFASDPKDRTGPEALPSYYATFACLPRGVDPNKAD